jgi:plastocyanin
MSAKFRCDVWQKPPGYHAGAVHRAFMVFPAAFLLLSAMAPSAPRSAAVVVVEMRDDTFEPAIVRIEPGDSVRWVNRGRNPHNVVATDGTFRSKILQTGDSFTVTFPKVGRFDFFCSLHGSPHAGMSGGVYVGVAPEDVATTSASHTYPADPPVRPSGGRTIHVPRDFASIQSAVDAAKPGDTVLVSAGTYHESVIVTTSHLTIRGEDRNRVVLDGAFDPELANGIAVFGADGVVLENMTARHYPLNGFYWRSVWGYRGSYLTAEGNGDYGIYAFDSGVGQFDHSYASGSPDSGFYIGQCDPCNALVTDVIARFNAIGFSATNASGNLVIRDSEWSDNMSGIVPNTLDAEALPPERGQTVVNNWVHDNNNRSAPAKDDEFAFFGSGIIVLGGRDNEIAYNRVEGHANVGIAVSFVLDKNVWFPERNRVHDNVVSGSGLADLALGAPAAGGNCFEANTAGSQLPPLLQEVYDCGSALSALGGGDVALSLAGLGRLVRATVLGRYPHGEPRDTPATPAQPSMPDISVSPAPAGPAVRVDPQAEVRRAAALHAVATERVDTSLGNVVYLVLGYGMPLASIVMLLLALAMRVLGLRGPRRRLVLAPLAAYVLFLIGVTALELVRP